MIRRPPRSTPLYSSAASDVYKRQVQNGCTPAGREPPPTLSSSLTACVVTPPPLAPPARTVTAAPPLAAPRSNLATDGPHGRPPTCPPGRSLLTCARLPAAGSCTTPSSSRRVVSRALQSTDGRGVQNGCSFPRVVRAPRRVPFFFFLVRALRLCTACVRVCASVKNVML